MLQFFQRMQSRYVAVMKAVFARAGGMNVDYVEVSIVIDSRFSAWWVPAFAGSSEGGVTWWN